MPTLLRLLPLLLILLEIMVFIEVGDAIGIGMTLLLVVLTTLSGILVLRSQGVLTMYRLRERLNLGESPVNTVLEGLIALICGVLLLIPGFITDIVGIIGLIPIVRQHLAQSWVISKVVSSSAYQETSQSTQKSRIIEGNFVRKDDDK